MATHAVSGRVTGRFFGPCLGPTGPGVEVGRNPSRRDRREGRSAAGPLAKSPGGGVAFASRRVRRLGTFGRLELGRTLPKAACNLTDPSKPEADGQRF